MCLVWQRFRSRRAHPTVFKFHFDRLKAHNVYIIETNLPGIKRVGKRHALLRKWS
jgi:hypothetical protein